jgi:FkbM family methyltransferase
MPSESAMTAVPAERTLPLALPPRRLAVMNPAMMYGADDVAAEYCGLASVPERTTGVWQHGWLPSWRPLLHPDMLTGHTTNPQETYWVAHQEHERFMRQRGYKRARAIGLPIAYCKRPTVERKSNSLLVMPAHSLLYTTHSWKFDEYADEIDAIRGKFDQVVVCVTPTCWKHGYWVDAFQKRDYMLVKGAHILDKNTVRRLSHLFATCEYVTTNSMGSLIAYASYFGAKVSIFGPYAEYKPEDYRNDPYFLSHPELLVPTLETYSEATMRRHYPDLFCHPKDARQRVDWAHHEVGADNKVSPREMRALFGWSGTERLKQAVASAVEWTKDQTPPAAKHLLKQSVKPVYRELSRLRALRPGTPVETKLFGARFRTNDAPGLARDYTDIVQERLFDFSTSSDHPRILDCGAGVGVRVACLKKRLPGCRVTAFEPHPRLFAVLQSNCDSLGLGDVTLLLSALWSDEGVVRFEADAFGGRVVDRYAHDDSLEVPAQRLDEYLGESTDLLILDTAGAEYDILISGAVDLQNVRNVVVRCVSFVGEPQRWQHIMDYLSQQGFRLHVRAPNTSRMPLMGRVPDVFCGTDISDALVDVFAVRK